MGKRCRECIINTKVIILWVWISFQKATLLLRLSTGRNMFSVRRVLEGIDSNHHPQSRPSEITDISNRTG